MSMSIPQIQYTAFRNACLSALQAGLMNLAMTEPLENLIPPHIEDTSPVIHRLLGVSLQDDKTGLFRALSTFFQFATRDVLKGQEEEELNRIIPENLRVFFGIETPPNPPWEGALTFLKELYGEATGGLPKNKDLNTKAQSIWETPPERIQEAPWGDYRDELESAAPYALQWRAEKEFREIFGKDIGEMGFHGVFLTEITIKGNKGNSLSVMRRLFLLPEARFLRSLTLQNVSPERLQDLLQESPDFFSRFRLRRLSVWNHNLGDEGARILAPVLSRLTNLTHLDLGCNNLGDEGARILAPVLSRLTNLTHLDLMGNSVGVEGARVLAPALSRLTNLTHLNLWANNFGDETINLLRTWEKSVEGRKLSV